MALAVGTLAGIAIIVGCVIIVALAIGVVSRVVMAGTRRERTSRGTHRAGPGRS
jgi:hypothetical protein